MSMAHVTVPSRPQPVQVPIRTSSEASELSLPVAHAGDGETDLEILKSVPKQFEVNDAKSANWLVRRIMDSRSYATRIKEWAEAELRRAAREEQTLLFLFGRQIETWTKDEVAKMKGKAEELEPARRLCRLPRPAHSDRS